MIKNLTRLLGNIVGRVIKLLKQYIIEIYLAFIVLIVGSAVTVGQNLRTELKWTINLAFTLAILGFILMIKTIISKSRDERYWRLKVRVVGNLRYP